MARSVAGFYSEQAGSLHAKPLLLGSQHGPQPRLPISKIRIKVNRAKQHVARGQSAEAERLFREILSVDDKNQESLEHLVVICLQTGRRDEAEQHLRKLINLFPKQTIYPDRLVTVLERQGKTEEAITAYQQVLDRNPDLHNVRYNLARLLKRNRQPQEALQQYEICLNKGIERPEEVHSNISVIYSDLQQHDAARKALQTALKLNPKYLPALFNLALLEEEKGDWTAARELFGNILELDSTHAGALAHLANGQNTSDPQDPLFEKIKQALRWHKSISPEREELLYALGKVHDDCGLYDAAIDYYQQANLLSSKRSKPYDSLAQEKLVNKLIAGCDMTWLKTIEPVSLDAHVFICGMFRSGSTLMEQILAAHPAITAGGEIDYFQRKASPFPEVVLGMDKDQLQTLGRGYNTLLEQLFPGADRVSNKRPDNFLYLGLIRALFPNARIIQTRRHPLDNCLSLFFQPLDTSLAYANSLQDAGHYYLQYCRVMSHWQPLLDENLLTVDYEELVSAPRETIATVLGFLQLDWQEQCLMFHEVDNRVRTASAHQVRQPMYQHASGRWQHYTGALASLHDELKRAGACD